MKLVSGRSWKNISPEISEKIEEFLKSISAKRDENLTNPHELWRFRYSDATVTCYKKGTVYITDSEDPAATSIHEFICSLLGSSFIPNKKTFSIGFDETGKGEVLGHTILLGVIFPTELTQNLERDIGVANTKVKHRLSYWDEIFRKIDYYKRKGLNFLVEKIPPWQIDRYNINRILDVTYQRMIISLSRGIDLSDTRVVIDDYGIGFHLKSFLEAISKQGTEIAVETSADENYLESRVASIIAKREQQIVLNAISKNSEYQINGLDIGSGNAGDPSTVKWLEKWKATGSPWPWFVKRSFKTIRKLDTLPEKVKKAIPPLDEKLLSKDFIEKFNSGILDITSLSTVCPRCGNISRSIKLIPKNYQTTPICIHCNEEVPDINLTLNCYCGFIVPDNNAIASGFISKDLNGRKFFENFTFILNSVVRWESDQHRGCKRELERIGKFASIGRIKFMGIGEFKSFDGVDSTTRDELTMKDALENNAILLTGDANMKGRAQAKELYVMEIG